MEQSISGAVEHRVHMPAHGVSQPGKGAKPEQLLNGFVRVLAFTEKVGNALGTLAFTWATVVLLGGFPMELRPGWFHDFWCATVIVFLEATRYAIYSRDESKKKILPYRKKNSASVKKHGVFIPSHILIFSSLSYNKLGRF
jgi:hypothetical protein